MASDRKHKLLHTPFEYWLKDSEDKSFGVDENALCFYTMGCTENGFARTAKNWQNMHEAREKTGAKFAVQNGDNNHHDGVTEQNWLVTFQKYFHALQGKKFIVFGNSGNHDQNAKKGVQDLDRLFLQIDYTFKTLDGKPDPKKEAIFSKKEIDLAELKACDNPWNMPGRFGVLHIGIHIDLFFVDSSTLARDFHQFYVKGNQDTINQCAWFFRDVAKSKARVKEVFLHHPLRIDNKGSLRSDHGDYLLDAEYEEILQFLKEAGVQITRTIRDNLTRTLNYNELLEAIIFITGNPHKKLDAGPGSLVTVFHVAHLHGARFLHLQKPSTLPESKELVEFRQVTSGWGGGTLQYRFNFDDYEGTLCAFTDWGMTTHTITPSANPSLTTALTTLDKQVVTVKDDKIVQQHLDEQTKSLRDAVMAACNEFQAFLKQNPFDGHQPMGRKMQMPEFVNSLFSIFPAVPDKFNPISYLPTVPDKLNPISYLPNTGGKVYDWMPPFIVESDHLKNFFNQEIIHFAEAKKHLVNRIAACKKKPGDLPFYEKLMAEVPTTFVKQMELYYDQWCEIFQKHLGQYLDFKLVEKTATETKASPEAKTDKTAPKQEPSDKVQKVSVSSPKRSVLGPGTFSPRRCQTNALEIALMPTLTLSAPVSPIR